MDGNNMWLKRILVGLFVAFVSMFLLKDLPFGMLLFLIGLIIAGLPGTLIIFYLLSFTQLLQFTLPIIVLYIWLFLDIFEFGGRIVPKFLGFGLRMVITSIIVKFIILIIFAYPVITDILSGVGGI